MTECPLGKEVSLGRTSVRDDVSCDAQLSLRGKQVLPRLLAILPPHLQYKSASRLACFSPALLFSICDTLQDGRDLTHAGQADTPTLPTVLSKLRDWRLLDPSYRQSSRGIHKLALDLAAIADETFPPGAIHRSSRRLRIKWVGLDPPSNERRGPCTTSTSSTSRFGVLDTLQKCTHVLAGLDRRHPDTRQKRLSTPDSEDSRVVVPRRRHAVSGFRSGCSACRHPRISGASTPPSPQMTSVDHRMPFGDVNLSDTDVNTNVASPRRREQRATSKRPKKGSSTTLQSTRGARVDENDPPAGSPSVRRTAVSFPCQQRTHSPRPPNATVGCSPTVRPSTQRRVQPSRLPIRTREDDKRTSSHRVTSTSVDLVLPIARRAYSPSGASPIDLQHLRSTPNRAQRASCLSVTSSCALGSGSISSGHPKRLSNVIGRSGTLLPFWNETYRRDRATTVTTAGSGVLLLTDPSSSRSPAKARAQQNNGHAARPWGSSSSSVTSLGDARARRLVPAQRHRHTQSAHCHPPLSSTWPVARKRLA